MNKLLQISLLTALLATSGFATSELELQDGAVVKSGVTLTLEKDQVVTIGSDRSLDNYGTIQGPHMNSGKTVTIKCDDGIAYVYNHSLELTHKPDDVVLNYTPTPAEDVNVDEYYITRGSGAQILGNITYDNVIRTDKCDISEFMRGENNKNTVAVILGENDSNRNVEVNLENLAEDSLVVKASIANGGLTNPHPLRIKGKFDFYGDQSHFENKEVIFDGSESAISGNSAMFNSVILLSKGSVVTVDPADKSALTLTKDITINSGSKLVFKNKVTFDSGLKLTLGDVEAQDTINGYPGGNNFIVYQQGHGDYQGYYYGLKFKTDSLTMYRSATIVTEEDDGSLPNYPFADDSYTALLTGNGSPIHYSFDRTTGVSTVDYSAVHDDKMSENSWIDGGPTYSELYLLFSEIYSNTINQISASHRL